jgi:hypothetical protein
MVATNKTVYVTITLKDLVLECETYNGEWGGTEIFVTSHKNKLHPDIVDLIENKYSDVIREKIQEELNQGVYND